MSALATCTTRAPPRPERTQLVTTPPLAHRSLSDGNKAVVSTKALLHNHTAALPRADEAAQRPSSWPSDMHLGPCRTDTDAHHAIHAASQDWFAGWLTPPFVCHDTHTPSSATKVTTTHVNVKLGMASLAGIAPPLSCNTTTARTVAPSDTLLAECARWCEAVTHQRALQRRLSAARGAEAALRQCARRIRRAMREGRTVERDLCAVRDYYARHYPDWDLPSARRSGEAASARCWPPLPPLHTWLPSRRSCLHASEEGYRDEHEEVDEEDEENVPYVYHSSNSPELNTVQASEANTCVRDTEKEEVATAKEAWRCERARLCATARRLRAQRRELEFHIRRGTHIKEMDRILRVSCTHACDVANSSARRCVSSHSGQATSRSREVDVVGGVDEYALARLRVEHRAVMCALRRSREHVACLLQSRGEKYVGVGSNATATNQQLQQMLLQLRARRAELTATVRRARELMRQAVEEKMVHVATAAHALETQIDSAVTLLANTRE